MARAMDPFALTAALGGDAGAFEFAPAATIAAYRRALAAVVAVAPNRLSQQERPVTTLDAAVFAALADAWHAGVAAGAAQERLRQALAGGAD